MEHNEGPTIAHVDNGFGKSGHIRKRDCCFSGPDESILRNIYTPPAGPQRAVFDFTTGTRFRSERRTQVATFGQHGHRRDGVDTTQADLGVRHRLQRLRLHCQAKLVLKARHPALRLHVLLERHWLNRMAEGLLLQPAKVSPGSVAPSLVDRLLQAAELARFTLTWQLRM